MWGVNEKMSPPARGAWIETFFERQGAGHLGVAPRAGHTKGGRFAHSDRDLQLDPIVRRVHEILLRAEIPFSRLN